MPKLPSVAKWLMMTQDQVLNKFQGIPSSFTDGRGQERFVYIRGTRPDRILLVAHADTVWNFVESGDDSRIKLKYENDIISTNNEKFEYYITYQKKNKTKKRKEEGIGIGADDRAGCALVWELRNLGHSILITSGEECGCIATNRIMKSKWWQDEIEKHQFAVQFDRRGRNDIVFYDVGTNKFVEYVKQCSGYEVAEGTTTDIRHLCEKICGVNISVGYYDEHTVKERLNIQEFNRTLKMATKWLTEPNIPRFALDKSDIFKIKRTYVGRYCDDYEWFDNGNIIITDTTPISKRDKLDFLNQDSVVKYIKCPYCQHRMLQEKWLKERFICEQCGNG